MYDWGSAWKAVLATEVVYIPQKRFHNKQTHIGH